MIFISYLIALLCNCFVTLTYIKYLKNPASQYIVLLVFGFLASRLGYADLMSYKNNTATGKERISRHLTILMGGTNTVITAVLSTPIQRFQKNPSLIRELETFKRRIWWPEVESNHRHGDFQSPALPTELSGLLTIYFRCSRARD